jgi:carbon monoxide dehydrogenase subunit G
LELTGSIDVAAPRDRVWAFVTDPRQIGACGPGVESIEAVDATHYLVRAKVGVGMFSVGLALTVELGDIEAPDHAVLRAGGQNSGIVVDATGELRLSGAAEGPTTIAWTVTAAISGSTGGLPMGLIEGIASKQLAQAFECVRSRLEA